MSDLIRDIRDRVRKIKNGHCAIEPAQELLTKAADEIERLQSVLVDANNNWRHDFAKEVDEATDKLFRKLAAHRTDPFARKA